MRKTTFAIPLAFLVACTGKVPGEETPDAGDDADADPGAQMVTVSGTVMDYFSPTPLPLSAAVVTMEGVIPAVNNTSDMAGLYTLQVPPGTVAYALATRTAYRPTRNVATVAEDPTMPVMQDVYVGSSVEVQTKLYNDAVPPITYSPGTAAMVAELYMNNGMPLEGIPIGDVTLVDNQVPPQPILGIAGPFFMNALGNPDANILTSTAIEGRVRVAIMNCPPGSHQLKVSYTNQQQQIETMTVPVMCDADGFTLARTGDPNGMPGGGGGMMLPQNPTFTEHIYPRLQLPAIAAEGRACAGCHRQGGTGPWSATGLAADVHAILLARPGVIDLVDPTASLFLTKPLYELVPPQNHPNATFLDVLDKDYIMFMCWIQQGAPLDVPGVGTCDYTGGVGGGL
jgi:hypothetical protein